MMTIPVEVAIALPDEQIVVAMTVAVGCTAQEALTSSGLLTRLPQLAQNIVKVGIFGKVIDEPDKHVLSSGDRVEVYRALLVDPKEARRQRAGKVRRAAKP